MRYNHRELIFYMEVKTIFTMRKHPLIATLFGLICLTSSSVHADTIDAGPGVDNLAVLPGDVITIHGVNGHTEGMYNSEIMVKRAVVMSHDITAGVDQYSFNYTVPNDPSFSEVDVVYVDSDGRKIVARALKIHIDSSAPLVLGPIPAASFTDVACKPQSVDSSVATIQGFLDSDNPITITPGGTMMLPINKTDSGIHSFYAVSTDGQGYNYRTPALVFSLPLRVRVAIPKMVVFYKIGQLVPVSVTFIPGLTPSSVNYMVNQDVLGTATKAPWTAKIPLPGYQTGDYNIVAQVTSADGAVFKSEPVPFHLTNEPADDYRRMHPAAINRLQTSPRWYNSDTVNQTCKVSGCPTATP